MSFHPDITDCEQSIFRSKIRVEERKEELAVGREPASLTCHEPVTLTYSLVLRNHAHTLICFASFPMDIRARERLLAIYLIPKQ